MSTPLLGSKPSWLKDHPKDLIFCSSQDSIVLGQVWYRLIDIGFEIDYLEVPFDLRRKGNCIQLLQEFIEFCNTQFNSDLNKSFQIWLEVSDLNLAAINMYLKFGFKQVGLRPKYYPDGSDAILMNYFNQTLV